MAAVFSTSIRVHGWRTIAVAGTGAAVLAVSGFGVSAALNASASNTTAETVTSGTLSLGLANSGDGFGQSVTGMIPGDVVNRYVDLTNNGDTAANGMTLAVAATGTGSLITDGTSPVTTKALRVTVSSCATAWNTSTGACSGGATTLLSATPLSTMASAQSLISGAIAVNEVRHLQVALTLPDQNETTVNGVVPANTVQGGSVALTYTFTEAQRAASTTNS